VDWFLRTFHGYTTDQGATYNAYLIMDEKVALIDTVKAPFAEELLARVAQVVPLERVDYLVSNHVEMDHSGAIPQAMARMPKAQLVTCSPQGQRGLTAHYGAGYPYLPVKAGDSISLGRRTLRFIPTPMLHWPDNMMTYCPEEKILFSNDAFGQHYASGGRFDDEEPLADVMRQAAKYYANIVMPYPAQAKAALKAVEPLAIDLIAPSHGVIWRAHIPDILAAYKKWSDNTPPKAAVVVFDSMWHSTEKMALAISEGFLAQGVCVKLHDLKTSHMSDIITDLLEASCLAVGSPTLNNNLLPTVSAFLTYLAGLAPKGRKGFAFGSYGWGGQSIGQVGQALTAAGIEPLMEPVRQHYVPGPDDLAALTARVRDLAL
jgi:flavorubredoxin